MVKDLLVAIANVGCYYQEVDDLHSLVVVVPDISERAVYVYTQGQGRDL